MTLSLEMITAERSVISDRGIDVVVAPGAAGELAILPKHAPLLTPLAPGELRVRKGAEEAYYFVAGGFLEVRDDRVTILADAAEQAEEIDVTRAEEARRQAAESLAQRREQTDLVAAEIALRRALFRLRVAERGRRERTISGQIGPRS